MPKERKFMKTLTYQQTTAQPMSVPTFDPPIWTLGRSDGVTSCALEEFHFPDRVIIVGTLKPYYVETTVTGHYQDNSGAAFSHVPLYGDRAALSRIEWVADWIEQHDGAVEELEDPLVWGMDFVVQEKNITACYTLPSVEHPGFWNITNSVIEPVWSWGGMYAPGCALADIKPKYFSLLPSGVKNHSGVKMTETKIAWVSSINPRYQKLYESFECEANDEMSAEVIFQPMSLLNHIQFGSITYVAPHVTDLVGYQSADALDYDPENGRVKLLFLRRNHGNNLTQH